MTSYMSIKSASSLWGCSERSIQMLCKKGNIPGAKKISGVWLLPEDSPHPKKGYFIEPIPFQPESLYGSNTIVKVSSYPNNHSSDESGCTITQYEILKGIILVFQDIHEETLDYENGLPHLSDDLIAIQHCKEGRFEGEYSNGEYIFMGPGYLSINMPACAPTSNNFPLGHYRGLYIAILPKLAEISLKNLEQVLGPLGIDFSVLSKQLSTKNKLAICPMDNKISSIISDIYPVKGDINIGQLKLKVLELLQILCTPKIQVQMPEQYFTQDQVQTVKEVRKYLIKHIDQRISLPELATKFHMSLTSMKSCFKGVYGQSIGKHLREYRIHSGAELLTTTNYRIIEIASALGYKNASKFSEAFAGYYGISPSEYRKTFCPTRVISNSKE